MKEDLVAEKMTLPPTERGTDVIQARAAFVPIPGEREAALRVRECRGALRREKPMERVTGRWRVGAELVPVLLVLASVAGSLALVIGMHRRTAERPVKLPQVAVIVPPRAAPPSEPPPKPEHPRITLPDPTPPADPTAQAVADLTRETEAEKQATERAERMAASIEQSIEKAKGESDKWRVREALVRKQVDGLEQQAKKAALEADELDKFKDALAIRLEIAKEDLAKARTSTGTSILPYKGSNGTWRRPLPIECNGAGIRIQPSGPSFSLADLSSYEALGRRSPVILAVVRELLAVDRHAGPDGAPVVPYLLFLVRPDGIRAYYDARARLEPIGIAFGYELVDQNAEYAFPDLNDPEEWRDALEASNLATNSANPGGSGGLRPWTTESNNNSDLVTQDARRGLRDPTEPGGGLQGRGYRGAPVPPGEIDPRRLANLANGRGADPNDDVPDDGRVELFPGSRRHFSSLPVLTPTPPTGSDGPGGWDTNSSSQPGSRGQPLGLPSRSLPVLQPERFARSVGARSLGGAGRWVRAPSGRRLAASTQRAKPGNRRGSRTPTKPVRPGPELPCR